MSTIFRVGGPGSETGRSAALYRLGLVVIGRGGFLGGVQVVGKIKLVPIVPKVKSPLVAIPSQLETRRQCVRTWVDGLVIAVEELRSVAIADGGLPSRETRSVVAD